MDDASGAGAARRAARSAAMADRTTSTGHSSASANAGAYAFAGGRPVHQRDMETGWMPTRTATSACVRPLLLTNCLRLITVYNPWLFVVKNKWL